MLRFFAFFSVFITHSLAADEASYVAYHLPASAAVVLASINRAGAFGVNLFFMLSAYLITALLLREKETTSDVHLASFYVRRILRIWPLYFLMLAIASLWPIADRRMPASYLLAYLLLAGNWMTAIFGPSGTFAGILWSVSIEEQFYLSWPLVVKRLNRRGMIAVAISLILVANITRAFLSTRVLHPYTVWPNTFVQLDPIAMGILVALLLNGRVPQWSAVVRVALAFAGLIVLVICGHYSGPTPAFTVAGYPAISLACLALLLATLGLRIPHNPLVYLGKISYGLYVFHTFSLYLVGQALQRAGTPLRYAVYWTGSFALTIILAAVSYQFVEKPFLRMKERLAFVPSRPV